MQRFRNMPIKWKLIVISLLTSGIALLVASVCFLTYDQFSFRESMRSKVQTLARVISENSTAAVSFGDAEVATRVLAVLRCEQDVRCASVRNRQGVTLGVYCQDSDLTELCPPHHGEAAITYHHGMMRVYEPVVLEEECIGMLCILYSLRTVHLRLVRYVTVMSLVLLLSITVAWLLASRLQAQVSGPILELTTLADRVSREKDLSLRVDVESEDELGDLVRGFNSMLAQIRTHETELRRYQDELRDMADRVLLTEESERRRISVGLHDSICQLLWVASMHLKKLSDGSETSERQDMLNAIQGMVDESLTEVRSFVFELSPPALHDLGLCPALKTLADEMSRRYGLQVELSGDNVEREYGDELNVFLYRAVREVLTNTAKHAKAEHATIEVSRQADCISLTVSDDGVGFFPQEKPSSPGTHGFGLVSIRERMNSLHGRFDVVSAPGEGTTVLMEVPRRPSCEPELTEEDNGKGRA